MTMFYTNLQSPINVDPNLSWISSTPQLKISSPANTDTVILRNTTAGQDVLKLRVSGGGVGVLAIYDNGGVQTHSFLTGSNWIAQSVAIGKGSSALSTSVLELSSTTQGFLPPRMSTAQKNAISSPATGLMVYDTTLNKLCVYTGSAWETITSV